MNKKSRIPVKNKTKVRKKNVFEAYFKETEHRERHVSIKYVNGYHQF